MAPTLNKKLLCSYLNLPQPVDKIQCMYVWVDGSLRNLRCKSRTTGKEPKSTSDLPRWEFCGSATELDVGDIADVYAQPVALYKDPFRTGSNKLVLCETYTKDGIPTFANNRQRLLSTSSRMNLKNLHFEIYQPYALHWSNGKQLCLMDSTSISNNGNGLFCGKSVSESHYRACLYAGVNISSLEPIGNSGKWRYSVGSENSVTLGDDLWISRFILHRVAEDFGVTVCFQTSPETSRLTLSGSYASKDQKQSISEALTHKFHSKEEVALLSTSGNIFLSGLTPDSDPYSVMTKVYEAFPSS